MIEATHPVGHRPPTPRASWSRAIGAVVAGCLFALLAAVVLAPLLNAAGVPARGWSVGSALYIVLSAAVTAFCVRLAVASITWRVVSYPALFAIALLAPLLLVPAGRVIVDPIAIVVAVLLVRYRSKPDSHFRSSVGYRLASRAELERIANP